MSMCHGDGPKIRVHLWRPDDFVPYAVPLLRSGIGPIMYGWTPIGETPPRKQRKRRRG
jgi:hypothetical protein